MTENHIAPWTLLKTPPGICPQCAVDHDPLHPHNQQSMYWQIWFYQEHGRWPSWTDAMEHCTEEAKETITKALTELGVSLTTTKEHKHGD